MRQFLVIQTAFLGDVVLATAVVESLHQRFPEATIDMLVRKGNEPVLAGHPFLREVLVWDKTRNKYGHLFSLWRKIRIRHYDAIVNIQRYAATGLLTALGGAKESIGFDKNPWSPLFTRRIRHQFSGPDHPLHETVRNQHLIAHLTGMEPAMPRLYPSDADRDAVRNFQKNHYICIAPASVWFTKQYPAEKWISFIDRLPAELQVYLTGGPSDTPLCGSIKKGVKDPGRVRDLCGSLSMLGTVALMEGSIMNFVNDSAPLHFASAVNAPVTAIYCSTVPAFGYGPLSVKSTLVETPDPLPCRPCGLHGKKACPEGHFRCALGIRDEQLLGTLPP